MADRRLFVEIEVEGNAVKVFKEIGRSAKEAAGEVVQSGERAQKGVERIEKAADKAEDAVDELAVAQKKAAKAADEMAQHSEKSAKSLDRYRDSARQMQQGMALLGGAFTMYANQAREHEITVLALERIYGTAAASYMSFAEQIQNTTIFSNDEALEAARIMGTLKENYDLTDQQIQKLIATSADLAAMHGFTLTDAAMRVQSAIRGEAESAEMLGLTMNQAAIDAEGLTLTMTNAEAAQFRFNAMMKQSASSAGFAAEAAETTAGQVQQLANKTQDAALAFVDFTGPIGDAAGALTSFGLEAGLALGGMAQLVRGMVDLNKAAGGARMLGGLSTIIGGGGSSLGLAGAISAAAGAAVIAAPAIITLGGAVAYLALTQDDLMESISGQTTALEKWASSMGKGGAAYQELIYFAQDIRDMTTTVQEMDPFGPSLTGADTTLNSVLNQLLQLTPDTFKQLEAALLESGIAIGNLNNLTNEQLQLVYQLVLSAWAQQTEAAIAQATAINESAEAWGDWEQAQNQASIAAANNAEAIDRQTAAIARQQSQIERMRSNLWDGGTPDDGPRTGLAVDPLVRRMAMLPQTAAAITAELNAMHEAYVSGVAGQVVAMVDSLNSAGQKFYSGFVEPVEQGSRAVETSLAELEEAYRSLAESAGEYLAGLNPQAVLSGTFGGVVGAAQGFANLSQQVADWSGSLAHGITGQTKLDELLLKGAISAKTYRDALDANHRIQKANNDVQEDALRIQAKQLPLMAQLAEEQARYVDEIADMSAEQQLVALGFMDTTKSAQAMQLAQLAAASATGEMQESTTKMIAAIAEADPQLKAMLIDMGLISETETGIEVNFGDVDDGKKALDALTSTLGTFTEVIAEIFGINVKLDDDNAAARLNTILARLNDIDGRQVTAYVNTVGLSSGALAATGTTVLPRAPLFEPVMPTIPRMATGGYVHLVGEAGPELVTLPAGAQVTNAAGTRGRLNPMGRSRSRGAGTQITNKGPVSMTVVVDSDPNALRRAGIQGQRR